MRALVQSAAPERVKRMKRKALRLAADLGGMDGLQTLLRYLLNRAISVAVQRK